MTQPFRAEHERFAVTQPFRVDYERFITGKGGTQYMLSKIPVSLDNVKKEDLDKEILRAGIIAELDAINLYEQMAAMAKNNNVKKTLLDIAKEEKTHVGEFLTLLLGKDREQGVELEKGKEEIEELIGNEKG
jgi:rubrerythrin